MTAYLGFQPMNDECSLMALAAFGKPRFYEPLKELVFNGDLETFQINKKFLNFNRYVRDPFTKKFTNTFGPVLSEPHEIKLSCVEKLDFSKIDAETKRIIDMAASVQKIFEVALHRAILARLCSYRRN